MSAAVLFRGHAYRPPKDGFTCRDWGVDWRLCVESQRRFLIEPLRERYGGVDLFLCYYRSPFDDAIERDYGPTYSEYAQGGASQRQTFLRGLHLIPDGYDLVATCRFDVELLKCPLDHGTFRPDCVNFLWREWNQEAWNDHRRVPDAIHFLPGELLDGFRKGVAETPSEVCMHMIYYPVSRCVGADRMHIQEPEGFRDSNTDKQENPVYKIVRVT